MSVNVIDSSGEIFTLVFDSPYSTDGDYSNAN